MKYKDIYLRAYETPAELRVGLTRYFTFYNTQRRHSALDRRILDAVYYVTKPPPVGSLKSTEDFT
ncbi:MAG: transposase [Gammaproteobacteria bacterium]|nr:transposase [Gammaproteobacteria bacterium]